MKLLFILLVSILPVCVLGQNKTFTVTGTIKNHNGTMIYLKENSIEKKINRFSDSCSIGRDGSFTLKILNTGEHLISLLLSTRPKTDKLATLINDTDSIGIQLDAANPSNHTITGSVASKELDVYISQLNIYYSELRALSSQKGDPEKLKTERKNILSKRDSLYTTAIAAVSNPIVAIYILSSNPEIRFENTLTTAKQLFKKNPGSGELKAYINNLEEIVKNQHESQEYNKGLIGKKAPSFSLPDAQGKKVTLQLIKNKYVLVDFWASWCEPCRMENKNVRALYEQYKDKGFTVIGISFDENKEQWLKAVQKDKLSWLQLQNSKSFSSSVAASYKIVGLPSNVLLDPTGNVIAVNIFRDELKNKLAELIK